MGEIADDLSTQVESRIAEHEAQQAEAETEIEETTETKPVEGEERDVQSVVEVTVGEPPAKEEAEGEGEKEAEDAEAGGEEAPEDAEAEPKKEEEPPPPVNPLEQKFTVKILGEEHEVSGRELVVGYQKSESADRRLKEAAEKGQQIQRVFESFMEKPLHTLRELLTGQVRNPTIARKLVKEIVSDYIDEELTWENMTPEERRIHEEREELRRERDALKAGGKPQDGAADTSQAEVIQRLDQEILDAVAKYNLPDTQDVKALIARQLSEAYRFGYSLTAEEAAGVVVDGRRSQFQKLISTLPPGELRKRFPEREAEIAQIEKKKQKDQESTKKAEATAAPPAKTSTKPRRRREAKRFETFNDLFEDISKRFPR